jgi:hypothetical protein
MLAGVGSLCDISHICHYFVIMIYMDSILIELISNNRFLAKKINSV